MNSFQGEEHKRRFETFVFTQLFWDNVGGFNFSKSHDNYILQYINPSPQNEENQRCDVPRQLGGSPVPPTPQTICSPQKKIPRFAPTHFAGTTISAA